MDREEVGGGGREGGRGGGTGTERERGDGREWGRYREEFQVQARSGGG